MINFKNVVVIAKQKYIVKSCRKEAAEKTKGMPELSSSEKKAIDDVWNKYCKVDYNWFRFYKFSTGKFSPYYIPMEVFNAYICRKLNNSDTLGRSHLEEKNYFDLIFSDVKRPSVVGRNINDQYLDKNFNPLTEEELVSSCLQQEDLVVKTSWGSCQGIGVDVFLRTDDNFEDKVITSIKKHKRNFIVQNKVTQNSKMASLNKDSVNSIRLTTLLWEGDVKVLASHVRVGVAGNRVDNLHVPLGFVCGVDVKTGRFLSPGFDKENNPHKNLPNGMQIEGFEVPYFENIKEASKRLHYRVANTRIIGWDFTVDEEGNPILIECNMGLPGNAFHQLTTGPIFGEGELFKDIMDYTFLK